MVAMHLQDALGQFQVQLRADGRSPHTRRQYERHVRALIGWLATTDYGRDVEDLSPATIAEFLASEAATGSARGGAKKASTANAMRTSIRCFARWAHEAGLATTNPARLLRRARCTPPPPKGLHADEQGRLLEVLAGAEGHAAERDRVLILLLFHAGSPLLCLHGRLDGRGPVEGAVVLVDRQVAVLRYTEHGCREPIVVR